MLKKGKKGKYFICSISVRKFKSTVVATNGKKFGQNRGSHDFQIKWINLEAKKAINLGKIRNSHDFQSKWINLGAKKGKKFGQVCIRFF